MLDYSKITKLQCCNSYLENYNKIIKSMLGYISKFSCHKFICFLKDQEFTYTRKINDMEKTTYLSGSKIYEILRHISYDQPYNNLDSISINNPFTSHRFVGNFFIWKLNSCIMDSSFFYFFIYFMHMATKKFLKKILMDVLFIICVKNFLN